MVFFGLVSGIICCYLLVALVDLERLGFVMEQLGHMISPTKDVQLSDHKVLPTINLLDPISVKAWLKMRLTMNSYSERWIARHNLVITYSFLLLIVLICYSLFVIFKQVHYGDYRDTALLILTACDIFFISIFIILVIAKTSSINSAAKFQLVQVWLNRLVINELYSCKSQYFPPDFFISEEHGGQGTFRSPVYGGKRTNKEHIKNPLYSKLAEEAIKLWTNGHMLDQGLSQMVDFYDRIYEVMKHQDIYMSRSLIGQKVTSRTLASFIILLISGLLLALEGLTKYH